MNGTPPTLADVAARAGVSVATASRALSGTKRVSDDRMRRVRQAIQDLGYRHNAVASALRSQRTETVGLLLPRYSTGFLGALIESVGQALDAEGMSLVLRYTAADAVHDDEHVESFLARRVDGIIICPPSEQASRESVAAAGSVPVVQVGRHIDTDRTDSVGLDEDRATGLLIGHLAERGVRRLAVLGLDPRDVADERRLSALRLAAGRRGLEIPEVLDTAPELSGGIEGAERLLGAERTIPVDALVCANDDVALGALAVLRMRGIAVPVDAQVASLLDVTFSDAPSRPVTTLRHPWPAMGREAVRLLAEALAGDDEDRSVRRVTLAPRLLAGSSTRP